ncbi:MAG: 5'-nucleotidase [Gammaproteobacteria bacterium]|nr:5'-nucleotidase [Gammaproteobacteria bacterium]
MPDPDTVLTVAISSRALFNLDASDAVFRKDGLEAFRRYQIERENERLDPGDGFHFVKKLLNINRLLGKRRVDVILLSRNSADTGLRVFNSISAHQLDIVRAAFSSGESPYRYAAAFGCDLFLSTEPDDVRQALQKGIAAANLLSSRKAENSSQSLRIAFDGDAVLFSDQADRIFHQEGIEAFVESEARAADQPLKGGPFKAFLMGLHRLQGEFTGTECPIRTALVTARGAPAHERVIKTLRAWDIRLDESLFLGGRDKAAFLRAYDADVFFDDQTANCESAARHTAIGHVPHGVRNE